MKTITKKERDCLIMIKEFKNSVFPVRLKDLSGMMNIKPPSVLEILNRLEEKGLIKKDRGMIALTIDGEEEYKRIVTVHRTLEVLYSRSGIDADEACKKIGNFDFLVDYDDAKKISNALGNPKKCPHGKEIQV
ncbi:hypohtetical protein [Thermoplasma volcanium GSS1]|uniref:Hypohtetical protein n=1 Tax=Thermoplasma volcanium (strain ATCC 51530 / DSM 4299 / JCM 9571 / NBRC 15438 / GSS1) TaxID=273116 RepID=Q97A37_THEVO|nr:metal-dependent transcriptional regulator [Thermoplasma volcanium]BAB60115.1 hypohtetical protein [Thermoplasma volcanium GSS1]